MAPIAMHSRFILQVLAVSGCALLAQPVLSAELTPLLLAAKPQGQPRSDVGFDFSADTLKLRGAITTKLAGDTTLVTPQLVSSVRLASAIRFETQATFSNWNERTGSMSDAVESRVVARSVVPMLAEIEGAVGRNAAGESRRKLRFKMNDTTVASFLSTPIKLKANASIEQTAAGTADSTLSTGMETALVQQVSPNSALNRIGFKYTTQTGAKENQLQATTFSRSWRQNDVLRLGVEYELTRDDFDLQKAVRFTWQGYF